MRNMRNNNKILKPLLFGWSLVSPHHFLLEQKMKNCTCFRKQYCKVQWTILLGSTYSYGKGKETKYCSSPKISNYFLVIKLCDTLTSSTHSRSSCLYRLAFSLHVLTCLWSSSLYLQAARESRKLYQLEKIWPSYTYTSIIQPHGKKILDSIILI